MNIDQGLFHLMVNVLKLGEEVAYHHEADKHQKLNPDYIEVKLLEACLKAKKYMHDHHSIMEVEVIRQSDADLGATDTDKPPLPDCAWDSNEKRWFIVAERSQFFRMLHEVRCPFRLVPQGWKAHLLILEV